MPSAVNTNMNKDPEYFYALEPEVYVESTLKHLGREHIIIGHWLHEFMVWSYRVPGLNVLVWLHELRA